MAISVLEIDRRAAELRNAYARAHKKRGATCIDIYDVLRDKFVLSWIYHDQALEGVALTPQEITSAIAAEAVANDKATQALHRGLRNLYRGIEHVEQTAKTAKKLNFTVQYFRDVHALLCQGADAGEAGEGGAWRADIPLHRAYFHEIALPKKIQPAMQRLQQSVKEPEYLQMHPTRQAAFVHFELMRAFPFTERSGTVARLAANLILMHNDYLPAVIPAVDRQRYYESLRDGLEPLHRVTLEAVNNAMANASRLLAEMPLATTRPRTAVNG